VGLVCSFLNIYLLVIFARIIMSWFPVAPGGAGAQIFSVLYTVTEPVLGPIRRALPPIRAGAMGFDLSPIIVIIGTRVLAGLIGC
jgi:YggT family protein